jgi:riboflavin synthase
VFAGIIERVCKVASVRPAREAVRLEVELSDLLDGLELGASVAINGVCLTLAERRGSVGGFDAVPETWRLTSLSALKPGDAVNVERSLRVGDRLDGHFVQGHVDGVGRVERIDKDGGEHKLWISVDAELMRYIVRKGSIALDGTSLTVVDVAENRFSVALIPTTLERTVLGRRRVGDAINIETDILARLIVSRLEALGAGAGVGAGGGLTWQKLQEGGFLP